MTQSTTENESKPALSPGDIEIRNLKTNREYLQHVELQKNTWGRHFTDVVPISILKTCQRVGGVTAGAYAPDGELIGLVFGMTGYVSGRPVHWSDLLAVSPRARGLGLGRRMKLFQRSECLKTGCEIMQWTYDPLQALNANLNINSLGGRPIEYVVNMYEGATNEFNVGIGSDRFIFQWDLASSRVERALNGERPERPKGWESSPIANEDESADYNDSSKVDFPTAPVVRIAVPADINRAKQASESAGAQWRACTRAPFVHYMQNGYSVVGFAPPEDGSFRAYYILQEDAS